MQTFNFLPSSPILLPVWCKQHSYAQYRTRVKVARVTRVSRDEGRLIDWRYDGRHAANLSHVKFMDSYSRNQKIKSIFGLELHIWLWKLKSLSKVSSLSFKSAIGYRYSGHCSCLLPFFLCYQPDSHLPVCRMGVWIWIWIELPVARFVSCSGRRESTYIFCKRWHCILSFIKLKYTYNSIKIMFMLWRDKCRLISLLR